MPFTKITNWKDVMSQFGLEKAKELSKKLTLKANDVTPDNVAVDFDSEKTEAIVLFEYKGKEGPFLLFEYTGTAN